MVDETDHERAGITSFGRAVSSALINATPAPDAAWEEPITAASLRESILASQPFVGLGELLALSWALGIPVAYLRVFPWQQKRMAAMTVRIEDRWAILLARDSKYPAPIAFYLAHELGHIYLSHLDSGQVIVDLEEPSPAIDGEDEEENQADQFALELLTGQPQPEVLPAESSAPATAQGLAQAVLQVGSERDIEPGVLALCFGYTTQDWATANASLKNIYSSDTSVWEEVNRLAMHQLQADDVSEEAIEFLGAVLEQPSG